MTNCKWNFKPLDPDDGTNTNDRIENFRDDRTPHYVIFIRELIQNLLDAKSNNLKGPVKIDISIKSDDFDKAYLKKITKELGPYLKTQVPAVNQSNSNLKVLVIEEWGTTGLTGDTRKRQVKSRHAKYWHCSGKNKGKAKKGSDNGGAGHGEITYPMSSQDSCCMAYTIREDETGKKKEYIYGKCNLFDNPEINGQYFQHTGYWGLDVKGRTSDPMFDKTEIQDFVDAFSLKRKSGDKKHHGTSWVITRPIEAFKIDGLITAVLEQYFFPISQKRLIVTINGKTIDANKLTDESFLSRFLPANLKEYYKFLWDGLSIPNPHLKIPHSFIDKRKLEIDRDNFTGSLLKDLKSAQKAFDAHKVIQIQVPIEVTEILKSGNKKYQDTFSVFLQKRKPGSKSQDMYVRNSLYIPNETYIARSPGPAFALTWAKNKYVAGMVKACEIPSHVQFKYKLALNTHVYARDCLQLFRLASVELLKLFYNVTDTVNLDALATILPISRLGGGNTGWVPPQPQPCDKCGNLPCTCPPPKCKKCGKQPCVCPPLPKPKEYYVIEEIPSGYEIKEGADPITTFPFEIKCLFAKGSILPGNMIKKYKPLDFDISACQINDPMSLEKNRKHNELTLEVHSSGFSYEIIGFNPDFEWIVEGQ